MGNIERSEVGVLRYSTFSDRWQVERSPDDWPRDGATVEVVRTADYMGAVEALREMYDVVLDMWVGAEDVPRARDALVKAGAALAASGGR